MSINRVKLEIASLVCTVDSTMWPVKAARIAISAVSRSRDLADHDHVGVLPEDGPQGPREGIADLGVGLDLG